MGAVAAVAALHRLELVLALPLLPAPELAGGVSPLGGACVEAGVSAYVLLLMLYLPNWLASHRLPRLLFLLCMFPVMRLAKAFTGPALQPALALALALVTGGPRAAAAALMPYAAGPLVGAAAVGLTLRGRRVPWQCELGVPLRLQPYRVGDDSKDTAGRRA